MRRILTILAFALTLTAAPATARADNVWIWGVCTDLDSPYPPQYEPYNFDAIFRVKAPYAGWYRLIDNYGRSAPATQLAAGQVINTAYQPVDYNGSFKERLYYYYNGAWLYIDQAAPRWVDDGIYCP